jgi:hypothetical protein
MSRGISRLLIIIITLLLFIVHVPGPVCGEAGNTGEFSVRLALGEAVADPPADSPGKVPEPADRRQQPRAPRQEQQVGGTAPGGVTKEPFIREFVPSEEIEAGQSVDFPADI